MRRFGRRRRGGERNGRGAALDAARELERLRTTGVVAAAELTPLEREGIPADFAVLGRGEAPDGRALLVAWSPRSGADAWLVAVAMASTLAREEDFSGEVRAIAPVWPAAARRRLGLLRDGGVRVRAVHEPTGEGPNGVDAEAIGRPWPGRPDHTAEALRRPERRELWARAIAGLRGLAAKHGGALRLPASGPELVLGGRILARLEARGDQLTLHAEQPRRSSLRLEPETLADALDRLEGSIRKFLNERRFREGEEGLRVRLMPLVATAAGIAAPPVRWPTPGTDPDPLDFLGVDGEGRPTVGASLRELTLPALGSILDAWSQIVPLAGWLLADSTCVLEEPRLVLAAERFEPLATSALAALRIRCDALDVERAGRELRVAGRVLERPAPAPRAALPVAAPVAAPAQPAKPALSETPAAASAAPRRFEEISVFELADDDREDGSEREAGGARRRRRRGRGRRGRGRRDDARESAAGEPRPREARDARAERERPRLADDDEEGDDVLEAALESEVMVADAFVDQDTSEPEYDDEEEIPETAEERIRSEREARRRARLAKSEPEPTEEPEASRKMPRKRTALLVHADRDSIGTALVLARDLRQVEGIWVYRQADLMTFFRSVATDLREDTPICVIGFTASPARDVLQAASLYRDRLWWFDHHAWPPEDLEGLHAAVGADAVRVVPGLGSSLPLLLPECTRRSRFTDKLVDLLTGRFTHHDWERWGRLWWQRLGESADVSGEQRARFDPLLAGRPSDLAREAARAPTPAPPPELAFIAQRDFRVVHFGGYTLVRIPAPPELELSLAARIARERYDAQLALAWHEGAERVLLTGDDLQGRRALDLGAMVNHLAAKFDWVEALSDEDHVARMRVTGLAQHPDRLDEIVSEISMGRSILES